MHRSTLLTFLLVFIAPLSFAQSGWSLERCVAQAEQANLTIQNAALEIELAMQDEKQANGRFLPSVSGFASHGYNWGKTIDPFTNAFANDRVRANNFFLNGDVTLYQGFANQRNHAQSQKEVEVSEQALEAARVRVRSEVVTRFLSIVDLQERSKMANIQLVRSKDQLSDVQARVDGGLMPKAEQYDMQAQVAQEEFNVTDLENQLELAKLGLLQVMQLTDIPTGQFQVEAPKVDQVIISEPTAQFDDVLANARERFPAYRQAQLSMESAQLATQLARSGHHPTLRLSGSVGTGYSGRDAEVVSVTPTDPALIGFTGSGEDVFIPDQLVEFQTKSFSDQLNDNLNESLSLTLNIPIFNRFNNSTAVARAKIREQQAVNQVRSVRDQLATDVQNALADQRAAYRQYLAADRAHRAAEEAYTYAEQRFENGLVNTLQLRLSKADLDRAAAQMINSKYRCVLAQKVLDILQGIPLTL